MATVPHSNAGKVGLEVPLRPAIVPDQSFFENAVEIGVLKVFLVYKIHVPC